MATRRFSACLLWAALGLLAPCCRAAGPAASVVPVTLWQEETYWDGLISERTHSRAARESADPNLLPVLENITRQMAQQVLNLRQVEAYTKNQQDNLQFAFGENDPSESLATIQANLDTLSEGMDQIRNNLFYLAVRCRMASSQALPDPELTKTAATMIRAVQAAQLELNTLYADATGVQTRINSRVRSRKSFLRYHAGSLVRSIFDTQNSIFAVYNASYEIYLRSKS